LTLESEKAGIATDELRSRSGKPVEHKSHPKDFLKQAPLLAPVDPADDGPQASLGESLGRRQKKDLFLNVRGEIEQLHDLRDTGTRHSAETSQFRIILHRFLPQQPLEADASARSRAIRGMEQPIVSLSGEWRRNEAILSRRLPARKSTA
jgi:hypothetical protein